ncbi:protein of unknown function [Hyphomicrobium sp. 1Nfss2.1]
MHVGRRRKAFTIADVQSYSAKRCDLSFGIGMVNKGDIKKGVNLP